MGLELLVSLIEHVDPELALLAALVELAAPLLHEVRRNHDEGRAGKEDPLHLDLELAQVPDRKLQGLVVESEAFAHPLGLDPRVWRRGRQSRQPDLLKVHAIVLWLPPAGRDLDPPRRLELPLAVPVRRQEIHRRRHVLPKVLPGFQDGDEELDVVLLELGGLALPGGPPRPTFHPDEPEGLDGHRSRGRSSGILRDLAAQSLELWVVGHLAQPLHTRRQAHGLPDHPPLLARVALNPIHRLVRELPLLPVSRGGRHGGLGLSLGLPARLRGGSRWSGGRAPGLHALPVPPRPPILGDDILVHPESTRPPLLRLVQPLLAPLAAEDGVAPVGRTRKQRLGPQDK
mmetsp:Transcript_5946/g.21305  ORF Transcript_5946/g.21305 Transcript_5946/m.21305 type:complete len:344 (-) Transcript_5946:1098-2129(-)